MSTPRPQIVFLSRTSNGLAGTALKCQSILEERGCKVIHQPDFTGSWRDVKGMLVDKLIECDAAICLLGPACGMMMDDPVTGLKDERTESRHFSYTQLEMLVARDLPRPVFTYLCSGDELVSPSSPRLMNNKNPSASSSKLSPKTAATSASPATHKSGRKPGRALPSCQPASHR